MISFDELIMEDGIPIYLQIILYIKRGMVAGTIREGEELPSRRYLSARLGINPNTVQKAYHMLEEEGLIRSQSGAKSYAVLDESVLNRIRRELLENQIRSVIGAMSQMGLTKSEALSLIEKYWEG